MEKAKPFAYTVAIIFQGSTLRIRRLREHKEEIQIWSIPQLGINSQSLSEKPRLVNEGQARPIALGRLSELQETSCPTGHC